MEKNFRKNRVALLGALLLAGLVLAGLGTALGVGEAFRRFEKTFSAVVLSKIGLYNNLKEAKE